jgi:NADP-dependent 3-hydroxy acid dehydrogenase YdfG
MTISARPTALITGASRGIGRAIAVALAPTHDLLLTARDANALADVAAAATALGARCRSIVLDLRDAGAIAHTLDGLAPDVLVNNAGLAVMKPFLSLTADEWHSQVDVNVNALFHVTRAVLPAMVARGSGHVITIGSLAGRNTFVGGSCYAGTKHFVMGFTESLMLEVRDAGVKVSVVMPGSVDTDLFPEGTDRSWMLEPADVAEVVAHMVATPSHALQGRVEVRPLSPKRPRQ